MYQQKELLYNKSICSFPCIKHYPLYNDHFVVQIFNLPDVYKGLNCSLSNHAHQQFQMGNQQFEDLTLGSQRPTALIRRFGDLYLDGRVDALDSLDQMTLLKDLDALKIKILFSIVVVSFPDSFYE